MAIEAIALLRTGDVTTPGLRTTSLEDGVLLHTQAPFDSEPAELSALLRELVGDALDRHGDERGVLIIPSVAAPSARRYEGVVQEVGEGGFWVPLAADTDMRASLSNLLGSMFGEAPGDLLQSIANAAERGDADALQQMAANLEALLDPSTPPDAEKLAEAARSLTGGRGPDLGAAQQMLERLGVSANHLPDLSALMAGSTEAPSPADLADLVSRMQAQLSADPALLASLMEHFFGDAGELGSSEDGRKS
jgi:hypothetical protein